MWDRPRMAWAIYWIIIESFVQAQEFSTTVVKQGEDATIECGIQTEVAEGYLKWETMNNGSLVDLAYDIRDGHTDCDDRIVKCTLHANGSIQLESVGKEDGARYYRCLRGDADGYNYYSDHRLLVLSKESPTISQSPTSAIAFIASSKGIVHSYGEPVCEDDVDGNLPVVCYPPSGIIVDREYETIQCNCTDSDGLMDRVTFPVTRQMSSPPSIETPHRGSVSSYNIDKKGVLHGYNAPVCEDDVDGNLPVVCYPPSGMIVDREYETIQCNCTDSDGLMDRVTIPVTSVTHWLHPGWRKAFISLLVISILIIFVLILICRYLYKNLKMWRAAADPEEMKPIHSGTKIKQTSDLEDKIATPEATFSKRWTQSEPQDMLLETLQEMSEMVETMKNNLEEQHKNNSKTWTHNKSQDMLLKKLHGNLDMREKMLETMKNNLEVQRENISKRSTQSEPQDMLLETLQEMLEMSEMLETMKNNLEVQRENISKRSTHSEPQDMLLETLQDMLEMSEMVETKNNLEVQRENNSKTWTHSESQDMLLKKLHGNLDMREKMLEMMKNNLEEQRENISKRVKQWESQDMLLKKQHGDVEMCEKRLEMMKNNLEEQRENISQRVKQWESQDMLLKKQHGNVEMREKMLETMKNNLEMQRENISQRVKQWESQDMLLKKQRGDVEMREKMLETMKNNLEVQRENISNRVKQWESQYMLLKKQHGDVEMSEKMLETMKNNLEVQREKLKIFE